MTCIRCIPMSRLGFVVALGCIVTVAACSRVRVVDDRRPSKEGFVELGCDEAALLEVVGRTSCAGELAVRDGERDALCPGTPDAGTDAGLITDSCAPTLLSVRSTSQLGGRVSSGLDSVWVRSRCRRTGYLWSGGAIAQPGGQLDLTLDGIADGGTECQAAASLLVGRVAHVHLQGTVSPQTLDAGVVRVPRGLSANVCLDVPCAASELVNLRCPAK